MRLLKKSNEEFEKMVQKREVSVNEVYVCVDVGSENGRNLNICCLFPEGT